MLFFVDETWQEVGGQDVGALGAIAIPRARYNGFCRELWNIKHNVLGALELDDAEIKGNQNFAKSAFTKRKRAGHSNLLQAAEETFAAVKKYEGRAFAVWTVHEEWLLLRNPERDKLSQPYVELMHDFRRRMRGAKGTGRQGLLFFDNRGYKEDLRAAAAIQNFIVRIGKEWPKLFMAVPHFTPSAVSPGIQAADLVAYLAAHQNDPEARTELQGYWKLVEGIAFDAKGNNALREVNEEWGKEKGPAGQAP